MAPVVDSYKPSRELGSSAWHGMMCVGAGVRSQALSVSMCSFPLWQKNFPDVDIGDVLLPGGTVLPGYHAASSELVLEAHSAHPGVLVVSSDPPGVVRGLLRHLCGELGPTESAVVVVPSWPMRPPFPPLEPPFGQVSLLALEPPVRSVFSHALVLPGAMLQHEHMTSSALDARGAGHPSL